MKTALVFIATGFEEIEAITPIDLLRRSGIKVITAGLGSKEVTGAHGMSIICDTTVSEMVHHPVDAVILPGGMPGTTNLLECNDVLEIVRSNHRDNKLIAAICAAPKILDKSGILKGKSFTCYPNNSDEITTGKYIDSPVVVDGNLITGRAVGSAIDFSLAVIEAILSNAAALDVKDKIVY